MAVGRGVSAGGSERGLGAGRAGRPASLQAGRGFQAGGSRQPGVSKAVGSGGPRDEDEGEGHRGPAALSARCVAASAPRSFLVVLVGSAGRAVAAR